MIEYITPYIYCILFMYVHISVAICVFERVCVCVSVCTNIHSDTHMSEEFAATPVQTVEVLDVTSDPA